MNPEYFKIVDFIRDLYKEPTNFIPLHAPVFNGNEKKYLEECIESTYVSSVGKFVDQFEDEVAKYTGANKAVVCVNGTNALHLAMLLVGVEENTEVLTQPFTFIATINAISYCKALPVFIDVDKETLGLSPEKLEHWLKNNAIKEKGTHKIINKNTRKRITACVPMHTFGHPCRIDEIINICDKYNIPVVEDAAESLGSYYKNQHTGTFGEIGVLSFNGNKILTTGGGGMLLFKNPELAKKAKHLSTQAKVPHAWEYEHDQIGYNYRMPNINAALGLAQFEQIKDFLSSKRLIASTYKEFFSKLDSNISFISEPQNAQSNYWLNAIMLDCKSDRDLFLEFTNSKQIMTRPAWTLMNKLKMFKHCTTDDLTNAQFLEERIVNIPSSAILRTEKNG